MAQDSHFGSSLHPEVIHQTWCRWWDLNPLLPAYDFARFTHQNRMNTEQKRHFHNSASSSIIR